MYRKNLPIFFAVIYLFKNIKGDILVGKFVRTRPEYLSSGSTTTLWSDWIRCAAYCHRDPDCMGFQFYPDSVTRCRTRNPQTGFDLDQNVQTFLRLSTQGIIVDQCITPD